MLARPAVIAGVRTVLAGPAWLAGPRTLLAERGPGTALSVVAAAPGRTLEPVETSGGAWPGWM